MTASVKIWGAAFLLIALLGAAYMFRQPRYEELTKDPKLDFASLEYSNYVSWPGGKIRIDVYALPGMTLEDVHKKLRQVAGEAHFYPQPHLKGSLMAYSDDRGRDLLLFENGFSGKSKMPELVFTQDGDTTEEKLRLLSMPITGTLTPASIKAKIMKSMHP